jgi:Uncharacterized conserved protein (DUF2075)
MPRAFYSNTIKGFLADTSNEILGQLSQNSGFADEQTQKAAWCEQIEILKRCLLRKTGRVFFEFSIPRMGRRVDVVLIIENVIFVVEFKVGERAFLNTDVDQVWDYALDLKNFHETSHEPIVAPILVSTQATKGLSLTVNEPDVDGLLSPPFRTNATLLETLIKSVLSNVNGKDIDCDLWDSGRYSPTPTIIEAATALYSAHTVENISRSDASATNLRETGAAIAEIIADSKISNRKAICFVTGVPGAGKTLVGLDVATRQMGKKAGHAQRFSFRQWSSSCNPS